MSRIFERKEGQIQFVASSQSRLQLSRNYHMQYLILKLTVTHDNATAVFKDEAFYNLINQVEVVANGNQNLKQVPGNKLALNNVLGTSMKGLNDIKTANGTDLVSTVYAIIPFSMFNTVRPYDTILNTAVFSTFDLLINWGSSSNVGTGITVKSADLEVCSSSLVNYKRNATETIKYFKETSLVEEVTSTTNEMTISLPVKKMYKSLIIVSMVDGKKVNTVIKNVKIKSGTTVIADLPANILRAKNNFEFKPEEKTSLDGVHIIDFLIRGKLSDALDTVSNFNTLEVVLDVEKQTGTNNIYILSDTVEDTGILEK